MRRRGGRGRWAGTLLLACLPAAARAESRPTLDDFYERTRSRAEVFDHCLGLCGDDYALSLLLGAQVADPSTDAARPLLAAGPRLGLDSAYAWGSHSIVRGRVYGDLLHVRETGEDLTEWAAQGTAFLALYPDDDAGIDLSLDTLAAEREELRPDDFAQFTVHPYRVVDVEAEVAPHGIELDKDGQLAVPLGYAWRRRWAADGAAGAEEVRHTLSGAVALRGFQRGRRNHAQLDFLRLTRTMWDTPAGELGAWAFTAGYQRLSPGIDELQIWLLTGYGFSGPRSGWLAQLGAEVDLSRMLREGPWAGTDGDLPEGQGEGFKGPRLLRAGLDAHFVPDRETGRFSRVKQWRLGYEDAWRWLYGGLDYEGVALDAVATLHAFTPRVGVRPFASAAGTPGGALGALQIGLSYRLAFTHDERPGRHGEAPAGDRVDLAADWLF